MCNINAIMKKPGIDYTAELSHQSALSYARNSDGDGLYISATGTLIKSVSKIDYTQHRAAMNDSCMIITHQRFATKGRANAKNAHPYKIGRWIFAHNGNFSELGNDNDSDSYHFFDMLAKELKSNDVKSALEKILNHDKTDGSYSIILYDSEKNKCYYAKSRHASIYIFGMNDGTIYISTTGDKVFFENRIKCEYEIEPDTLYTIDANSEKPIVYEKMDIKERLPIASLNWWESNSRWDRKYSNGYINDYYD